MCIHWHNTIITNMDAFKHWLASPYRGWKKFVRALELTTQASVSAQAMIAMLDNDWRCGRSVEPTQDDCLDARWPYPDVPPGTMAIVGSEGEVGELAPDCPDEPLSYGDTGEGRRAALFRRYWVARVHAEYPRVVGNWDPAALAATRLYLCKAMKEPREYYVRVTTKEEEGRKVTYPHPEWRPDVCGEFGTTYRKKYKRGMTTMQIEHCVDWLVTAAHMGTPAMAAQEALRDSMRPNWLMRMFGLQKYRTAW